MLDEERANSLRVAIQLMRLARPLLVRAGEESMAARLQAVIEAAEREINVGHEEASSANGSDYRG